MMDGRIPVVASENHTVFYVVPNSGSDLGDPPAPLGPDQDVWDEEHVRLPCSPSSLYPVSQSTGEMKLLKRWAMVEEALLSEMHTSQDLENAIKSYNSRYRDKWDFSGLRYFIDEILCDEEREHFFSTTLPRMARLAVRLPELVRQPLPLLRRHQTRSLSLSQLQVASLLANAFFCTFPRRNAATRRAEKTAEYSTYPDINFNRLFSGRGGRSGRTSPGLSARRTEKLKCLLHYFHRVLDRPPSGALTFTRQYIAEAALPNWSAMGGKLRELTCKSDEHIEDQQGLLQVDFANKFVGGGVLGEGCVQEEIRFLINPELIVTRLFTEVLDKTECLVVTGCQRFSQFEGYADTFKWMAKANDPTPFDEYGRRSTQVVALDAYHFSQEKRQYEVGFLLRELNKAYSGFYYPGSTAAGTSAGVPQLPAVATGNWGCGVFNGNPRLKALMQLMAAAVTGRDLTYLTFGDEQLREDIIRTHRFLRERGVTVGQLYKALVAYGRLHGPRSPRPCVFSFLSSQFADDEYGADTDVEREDWSQEMEPATDSEDVPLVKETSSEMDVEAGASTAASVSGTDPSEQEQLLLEASFGEVTDGQDLDTLLSEKRDSLAEAGPKRVRRSQDGAEGTSSNASSPGGVKNSANTTQNGKNAAKKCGDGESAEMFAKFEVVSETSRVRTKQTTITSFLKKKS